jgi:hypothetical protein
MAPDHDVIRKRAYEIWEKEGRPHGRDMEHWQLAMIELSSMRAGVPAAANGGMTGAPKKTAPKKAPAKTKTMEAPSIVMPEPAKRPRTRTPAK